eukprot:3716032-Alexandrium_andersonii.AAC.1
MHPCITTHWRTPEGLPSACPPSLCCPSGSTGEHRISSCPTHPATGSGVHSRNGLPGGESS